MAGFTLDVRSDVNEAIRRNAGLQEQILRAAAKAVNDTAADVRKAAVDEIASRNPEMPKPTIKGYVTVRKAKYTRTSTRRDGTLRVNYGGIVATVTAAGKAPNLIAFVRPRNRDPMAFRNAPGVEAKVMGKTRTYDDTFIVRAKNGKLVVVARKADAQRHKTSAGWKWQPRWSKGIYGPSSQSLMATEATWRAMQESAQLQWPGYWLRRIEEAMP